MLLNMVGLLRMSSLFFRHKANIFSDRINWIDLIFSRLPDEAEKHLFYPVILSKY
jgi:hypothetical protein